MFVEIVQINNDSNTHHSVLLKQQSKQKLSNVFRARENVLFLSYLGSSALEIFMTGESKKFENNLSTKDKAG